MEAVELVSIVHCQTVFLKYLKLQGMASKRLLLGPFVQDLISFGNLNQDFSELSSIHCHYGTQTFKLVDCLERELS